MQVTAARDFLIGEVVGATAFGGDWEMSQETIDALLAKGWEKPWSADYRTFSRQTPLISANRLALQPCARCRCSGARSPTSTSSSCAPE